MSFVKSLKSWFGRFFKPDKDTGVPGKKKIGSGFKKNYRVKKNINVGIDFGTSSTKILYRDITENKGSFLDVYENFSELGYSPFCIPSTISLADDKIYFGSLAEKEAHRCWSVRSFKICFVCEVKDTFGCELNNNIFRMSCEENQRKQGARGKFHLGKGDDCKEWFSAKELTTYYLSYIIKIVRDSIDRRYQNSHDLVYTYNICAPIDQFSDEDINKQYEKTFYLAEKVSFFINNGMSVKEIRDIYKKLSSECKIIPGEEERNTFVLPETLASVMSYINSRKATDGLYGIVDIGAGTTDISFFRHSSAVGHVEGIYSARTVFLGMDDLDVAIYEHIVTLLSCPELFSNSEKIQLLQQIRIRKQSSYKQGIKIDLPSDKEFYIEKEIVEKLIASIIGKMRENYIEVWRDAYRKEMRESRWVSFILYVIGGGSKNILIFRSFFEEPSWIVKNVEIRQIDTADSIVNLTKMNSEVEDNAFLLSVAEGLSYHKIDWSRQILPFQIDPLPIRTIRQTRAKEELYPK
ncbi:MAG: hypothetical protein HQ593_00205 [Candidatus Omnitrophica bacterium]|nr:hypothetical protein [Candidatus Omnitrophota bacterium]